MPKERFLSGFTLDRAVYQRHIKGVGFFTGRFLASTALALSINGSRVSAAEDPSLSGNPEDVSTCAPSDLQPPPEIDCSFLDDQGAILPPDADIYDPSAIEDNVVANGAVSEPPPVVVTMPTSTPTPQPVSNSTLVARFDHAGSLTEVQKQKIQLAQSQVLDFYKNVVGQAVEGQVTNNYINDGPSPNINPAEGSSTLYTTNIWIKNGNPSGRGIDLESDFSLKELLAHEYDLWIQSMFYVKGGYPKGMLPPVWRNEGESELWAYRAVDNLLPGRGYLDQILRCDVNSFQTNQATKGLDLSRLLSNPDFSNQPGVYGLSRLGYNFLIKNEARLSTYQQEIAVSDKFLSQSGPLGADVSFTGAYNVDLKTFYQDFSKWLNSQPPTKC